MRKQFKLAGVLGMLAFVLVPAPVWGQFEIAGRKVQIHAFFSQGYAKSDQNNYLTMNTSDGSWAFTDGGVNISMRVTDRFRVGAQVYGRNIGELSNGRIELDWALGDYRFKDWLGVRGGKVKTVLGLYNDTQDMEFLHTWAILPQSVYPADLRASSIAHVGGDLYGDISLGRHGTVSYTAYGGSRPDDPRGGYRYGLVDAGIDLTRAIKGYSYGGDVRWAPPISGLLVGTSLSNASADGEGLMAGPYGKMPFSFATERDRILQPYVEFQRGPARLVSEYRRYQGVQGLYNGGRRFMESSYDSRSWYVSGAWRFNRHLELGSYYSSFISNWPTPHELPSNHITDRVITARVDITKFWLVKVEGHFMDGFGNPFSVRGFYSRVNPLGLQAATNMLVIRTGLNF
jgi:hypothetical protein